MSPSTVPAAARPPPLPVASTARPAPPTHTRPLGLRQWRQQRPARRRLHFPLSLPSRPTSWPDRSPGRSPPSALRPSRGGWLQPRSDPRASASASASLKSPYPSPPRAQLGLHAVWVPGPRQRLSGCPSSSSPGPRNLPGRPASLLGCSAVAPSLRVAAAGLRLHRVAQAALLRAQGPQSCRELPLQGWLSCSRLDAA